MNMEQIIILIVIVALFGLPFWAWLWRRIRGADKELPPEQPAADAGRDDKPD